MAAPDPAGTVRHPDDSPGPGHDGLYLGLISGTSADGIDAALVRFGDDAGPRGCGLVAGRTFAWDPDLRARLLAIGQGGALDSLDEYGSLDVRIGEAFAAAALALLDEAGVDATQVRAIGSHGQTLRHRPHGAAGDGRHPFSLQLGDGHVIAERTGITTVADFRRRDVAAGGHGAPLLPALHAALLADPGEDRAVLNLGGIANLTLLPSTAHAGAAHGYSASTPARPTPCSTPGANGTPASASTRAVGSPRPEASTRHCCRDCSPSPGSRRRHPRAAGASSSTCGGWNPGCAGKHLRTCRRPCSNSRPPPSPTHCWPRKRGPRACSPAAVACTTRC
jgi:hypothetical protein